jgi:hypothetical protein
MEEKHIFDNPDFKKAFWHWFDHVLSEQERNAFYEYKMDTAELYFYNKVYLTKSKGLNNANQSLQQQ